LPHHRRGIFFDSMRRPIPIVLASGRIGKPVEVPWWNGLSLRLVE